jgi:hypothetical protein
VDCQTYKDVPSTLRCVPGLRASLKCVGYLMLGFLNLFIMLPLLSASPC